VASAGLTSDPELRAGFARRAHRGTLAAATDDRFGGSEVQPACRHAVAFVRASERPARQLEGEVRRRSSSLLALGWPLQP
jgi:hypothetical protein